MQLEKLLQNCFMETFTYAIGLQKSFFYLAEFNIMYAEKQFIIIY